MLIDITVAAFGSSTLSFCVSAHQQSSLRREPHMPEYSQKGASIVGAVLSIDRGGLRTASACSASSGTACSASSAALGGNVIFGNGPSPATSPLNARADDGAAQPVDMAICLKTPSGPVTLTWAEFTAQKCAYAALVQRLNVGHSYGMLRYIESFGLINTIQGANHPSGDGWGKDVWSGMGVLEQRYVHLHRMGGRLVHGWFLLPRPFSRRRAGEHASTDEPGPAQYYPALFAIFPGEHFRMACLHILLMNCKPWWVHESRVKNMSQ